MANAGANFSWRRALTLAIVGILIVIGYAELRPASPTIPMPVDGVGVSGDFETRKILIAYNSAFSQFWGNSLLWECHPSGDSEIYRVAQFDDIEAGRDNALLVELRVTPAFAKKLTRKTEGWGPDRGPQQTGVSESVLSSAEADSLRSSATKLVAALASWSMRDNLAKGTTGLIDSGTFIELCRRGSYSFIYQHPVKSDSVMNAAYSDFIRVALDPAK